MKAYKMLVDSNLEKRAVAGTIVYPLKGFDYGCADDDTIASGKPHVSVTLDKAGGHPSFTAATDTLEEIEAPDFEDLTVDHVKTVCKPGTAGCCRYLVAGHNGWGCGKLTAERVYIDNRVLNGTMRATGNNCEGRQGNVK